ncbi:hypothetical protein Tco_1034945 [Tanacetum coccineum]
MSKSAKPDSHFFNNDFYYLSYVSMEKKYTPSLIKHYASRRYVEGIEDMVLDRWSKEVHKYHFDSLYEVMEKRTNLMKADLPRLSLNDIEDMYLLNIRGVLHHLNAEVDFINALLLYIRRIVDRFVDPDHPKKVYRLRKALYGLKQAPKASYDELSKFPGLEVGSIRRIQGIRYGVLEFLGVGTTLDIFQNLHILYLEYGVLSFSGYGVLSLFPLWSLVSAGTDTPYLP